MFVKLVLFALCLFTFAECFLILNKYKIKETKETIVAELYFTYEKTSNKVNKIIRFHNSLTLSNHKEDKISSFISTKNLYRFKWSGVVHSKQFVATLENIKGKHKIQVYKLNLNEMIKKDSKLKLYQLFLLFILFIILIYYALRELYNYVF